MVPKPNTNLAYLLGTFWAGYCMVQIIVINRYGKAEVLNWWCNKLQSSTPTVHLQVV